MQKRKQIGICVSGIFQIATQRLLNALCDEARNRNIDVQMYAPFSDLYEDSPNNKAQGKIFELIGQEPLDALIIIADTIKSTSEQMALVNRAAQLRIPVVGLKSDMEGACNVVYDIEGALEEMITHLIRDHHCRTINFIAGVEGNATSKLRLDTYKRVLSNFDIPVEEDRIGYGGFWAGPTRIVMDRFYHSGKSLPDAIVCSNDAMAIEACRYLQEQGIRVPGDVLVTGMGGILEREYHFPVITTGVYDPVMTSRSLLNTVDEILKGEREWTGQVKIPALVDYSESCGCKRRNFKLPETMLSDTYDRLAAEREYRHEVNELITSVNYQCDIKTLLEQLPKYVRKPGIASYQIFLKSELGGAVGLSAQGITGQVPLILLGYYQEGDNNLLMCPMDWNGYRKAVETLRRESGQLLSIPIYSEKEFYGVFNIAYQNTRMVHEYLYELCMVLNVCMDAVIKRFQLDDTNRQLNIVSEQTIQSLTEIVEAKSEVTGLHVKRVSEYTRILAQALNYTEEEVNTIRIASMMHDIGKINVPSQILEKKGKLTPEEFAVVKSHVTEGARMLEKSPGPIMQMAKVIALQHHEKWDGTGYLGMKKEEICREARVVALADVFDALVSVRPYKPAYSVETAYDIIVGESGTHFDPMIVECFRQHFADFVRVRDTFVDEEEISTWR